MSDLPATQEVRVVCQHEAAHAVVALSLGHEVLDIEIKLHDELGVYGATTCQDISIRDKWDPEVIYDDFLISLAGPVLDAAAGRTHPGSVSDIDHVNNLLVLLVLYYGGTAEQHLEHARHILLDILEQNSDRVFALCDLIMHGELNIREFEVHPLYPTFGYPPKRRGHE